MAEVFNEIDINLDGHVRLQEVIDSHQQAFGEEPSAQQIAYITDHFDGLDLEQIEFSDFCVRAINERILQTSDRLATAFRYFDTDGSGDISPEEIVNGFNFDDESRLDEDVAKAIMN